MKRRQIVSAALALPLMFAAVGALPLGAAAEEGTPASVLEREVLQAKLSPTGEQRQSRLYSQLTVEGDGSYTVVDPAATDGLRNLDGFGGPGTGEGSATWNLDVDGRRSVRTVADYGDELPVTIEASYVLDGEPIEPDDLVGRSGELTVTYTVRNVSGAPTELTYRDGEGMTQTETVDLPLPLAGQLESTLGREFSDVAAPGGVVVGDGRGNTKLKWQLILFEPLGAVDQEVSYTADVHDVLIPPATLQVVPVTLEQTPLSTGNEAYDDAADSTYELTRGAVEIDRNVLRLGAGATQLLDGLIKLADGAGELRAGLAQASSGSGELADGLDRANDGGAELATGLGELRDGAGRLSDGLGEASAGGTKLATGLGQLRDGSQQLSGGLGSANNGGLQLADGAIAAQQGARRAAKGAADIEDGMRQLEAGLLALADDPSKLPALIDGINQYRAQALGAIAAAIGTPTSTFPGGPGGATIPSARAIGAQVKAGLDAGSADLLAAAAEARTGGAQLQTLADAQIATVNGAKALIGCPGPAACGVLDTLLGAPNPATPTLNNTKAAGVDLATTKADALEAGGNSLATASAGMAGQEQILAGVRGSVVPGGAADQGLDALVAGVNAVRDGVRTDAAGGAGTIADFQGELAGGLKTLAGRNGLGKLVAGMDALSDGLEQLNTGGQALSEGAGEAADGGTALADGLGQLDDGGQQLADGAGRAADGGGDLSEGLGLLADGGQRLAGGLRAAHDGSGRLADGLVYARIGGSQIAGGANELSERGTSVLAGSVSDANAEQNRNVALIKALDERSRTDGMPAGAPQGGEGSAVYSFELAAATGASRDNAFRLVLAALLLVALGVISARRRVLAIA